MQSVTNRIIKWNRDRNELKFDPELELKMLSEEAREFFMAETFVDQVDAYCDFVFVATGTQAKINAYELTECCELKTINEVHQVAFETYTSNIKYAMLQILETEWRTYSPHVSLDCLLTNCLEIVTDANENKGTTKDESGKVQKGSHYVRPEESIAAFINSRTSGGIL